MINRKIIKGTQSNATCNSDQNEWHCFMVFSSFIAFAGPHNQMNELKINGKNKEDYTYDLMIMKSKHIKINKNHQTTPKITNPRINNYTIFLKLFKEIN